VKARFLESKTEIMQGRGSPYSLISNIINKHVTLHLMTRGRQQNICKWK